MKTIQSAWRWFSTTPASLAAAFLMLGLIAGATAGSYRPIPSCKPVPLDDRRYDCSIWDLMERWQTLLAALIALVAAAPTVLSIKRQLEEMSRQTAALAIGTLTPIAEQLEQEMVELRPSGAQLTLLLLTLQALPPRLPALPIYLEIKPALSEAAAIAASVKTSMRKHPAPDRLFPLRKDLSEISEELHLRLFWLVSFFNLPNLDASQSLDLVREKLRGIEGQLGLWHRKRDELVSADHLGGEIERLRQSIDRLRSTKLSI